MKNQFVTYEIALKLKELGFDEECFCTYHNAELSRNPSHKIDATPIQGKPYIWKNSKFHNSIVCAPLWQQVIDWLREEHNIHLYLPKSVYDGYVYVVNSKYSDTIYNDYYDAREQAILKAIELCKKNYHKI